MRDYLTAVWQPDPVHVYSSRLIVNGANYQVSMDTGLQPPCLQCLRIKHQWNCQMLIKCHPFSPFVSHHFQSSTELLEGLRSSSGHLGRVTHQSSERAVDRAGAMDHRVSSRICLLLSKAPAEKYLPWDRDSWMFPFPSYFGILDLLSITMTTHIPARTDYYSQRYSKTPVTDWLHFTLCSQFPPPPPLNWDGERERGTTTALCRLCISSFLAHPTGQWHKSLVLRRALSLIAYWVASWIWIVAAKADRSPSPKG